MTTKARGGVEVKPTAENADGRGFAVRVAIALGLAALFVTLGLIFYLASEVFVLAGAGLLVAVLLGAMADFVAKYSPIPRGWALGLVLSLGVGVLGFASWRMASNIDAQYRELSKNLVTSAEKFQESIRGHEWGRRLLDSNSFQAPPTGNIEMFGRFTRFFSSTVGGVVDAVIILFIGVYGAADPATYRSGLIQLFPVPKRRRAAEVVDALGGTLRRWLLGQLLVMTIVGVAVTVGLWLLGIKFALALGLLAFFLEFIPYVGPIASAVPGLLVASSMGSSKLLYVALFYFAIQSAEGYLLSPLIQERAVKIPPALTVLAQVLLGVLVGGFGLILATPLTAVSLVLVNELYIKDALKDRSNQG